MGMDGWHCMGMDGIGIDGIALHWYGWHCIAWVRMALHCIGHGWMAWAWAWMDGVERERPHGLRSLIDPFGPRSACVGYAPLPASRFLCGARADGRVLHPRVCPSRPSRARAHRHPPWTDVRRRPRGSQRHLDLPRITCRTDPNHRCANVARKPREKRGEEGNARADGRNDATRVERRTACLLEDRTRHIRKHTGRWAQHQVERAVQKPWHPWPKEPWPCMVIDSSVVDRIS